MKARLRKFVYRMQRLLRLPPARERLLREQQQTATMLQVVGQHNKALVDKRLEQLEQLKRLLEAETQLISERYDH